MIDPKQHAARRKLFARQFSKNGILQWEGMIKDKFSLAITGMERQYQAEKKVDLMVWWAYLASDLLGELAFGESFNTLERGEVSIQADCCVTTSIGTVVH